MYNFGQQHNFAESDPKMTNKIPFFRSRAGRSGSARHYWIPSDELRREGWQLLPLDPDPEKARAEAIAQNARVAAARSAATREAAPTAGRRTVRALITLYQAHRVYTDKAKATRDNYACYLRQIDALYGDLPVAELSRAQIDKAYVALRDKQPTKAVAFVKMLRVLLNFGVVWVKWCAENEAREFGLTTPARQKDPVLWTRGMVDAFVAEADLQGRHSIGTAVALNEWMGQREGDVLEFTVGMFAATAADIYQNKTGAFVRLPVRIVPHLSARADQELARRRTRKVTAIDPGTDPFIVSETTGRAYQRWNFAEWVGRIADAAAAKAEERGEQETARKLREAQFRWLRHTAVTRLAEAGCTIPEIVAVTGHSLKEAARIVRQYLVDEGKMSKAAFKKRLAADGLGEIADRLLAEER